jgi:hypothetical protein
VTNSSELLAVAKRGEMDAALLATDRVRAEIAVLVYDLFALFFVQIAGVFPVLCAATRVAQQRESEYNRHNNARAININF